MLWATWEGNTPELVIDGADLMPGIVADPITSIKFTIQPRVEDSVATASGGISPYLTAAILVVVAVIASSFYLGRKKSQSSKKQ